MQKIAFDNGVKTYQINDSATLSFNPSDPSLYKRFKEMSKEIERLRSEYRERMNGLTDGEDAIDALAQYDQKMKSLLSGVFGKENDFERIFGGANVMAIARNGNLIITNFLDAIRPIIESGVKEYAKMEAKKAISEVKS